MVQIDSHKVVINIFPSSDGGDDDVNVELSNHHEHPSSYEPDGNILAFLDLIDSYKQKITQILRKSEQEYLKRLRKLYEKDIDDAAENANNNGGDDIDKADENKNFIFKNETVYGENEAAVAAAAVDNEKEEKSTIITDTVLRSDLVKFLRLEKIRLRFKKVRSVKDVIDGMEQKGELDKK
jgi:hypothetical protein